MHKVMLFMIAISLSMDAFSLSLAYGTLNLTKKNIRLLSLIVGIYHFFMPLLGMVIGDFLFHIIPLKPDYIVTVVLFFIGIEMIIDSFKQKETMHIMRFGELLLFGLAVSLDSFSVGIGLPVLTNRLFLAPFLFSICAFSFTYIGLCLGKKINDRIGKVSTRMGGIVLLLIGILYIF